MFRSGHRFGASIVGLLCIAGAASAQTGSLQTANANNGSGGIFLELTALIDPLSVTDFELVYSGTTGTPVQVEVWTRLGSYAGFDDDPTAWTLTQTVQGTRQGPSTLDTLTLTDHIDLPVGQTVSVYLHAVTAGGGIRYTGTNANPPQVHWDNADLALFSDVSRTGSVAFASARVTPRTFAGVVHYDIGGPSICDAASFFAFLAAFAAGDPRADCNADGVIDADDFFTFLEGFRLGTSCCGF
ncbi:MAG: hypothetical protein JJU33_14755 [Phycisphaerales bacterium]|nr:hypothetical protein [Phycisphaerales bacterium]